MCGVADVELTGLQETADILQGCQKLHGHPWEKGTYLAAEAVANGTDVLDAEGLTDVLDALLHNGVDLNRRVLGEPVGKVGLAGVHVGGADGVAVEQVRDDSQVAIVGKLIGDELGVGELEAEDVGDEDDGLLGLLVVLGGDNVGLDWRITRLGLAPRVHAEALTSVNGLHFAGGSAIMLEASGTAGSGRVGGHSNCLEMGTFREYEEWRGGVAQAYPSYRGCPQGSLKCSWSFPTCVRTSALTAIA